TRPSHLFPTRRSSDLALLLAQPFLPILRKWRLESRALSSSIATRAECRSRARSDRFLAFGPTHRGGCDRSALRNEQSNPPAVDEIGRAHVCTPVTRGY